MNIIQRIRSEKLHSNFNLTDAAVHNCNIKDLGVGHKLFSMDHQTYA